MRTITGKQRFGSKSSMNRRTAAISFGAAVLIVTCTASLIFAYGQYLNSLSLKQRLDAILDLHATLVYLTTDRNHRETSFADKLERLRAEDVSEGFNLGELPKDSLRVFHIAPNNDVPELNRVRISLESASQTNGTVEVISDPRGRLVWYGWGKP